MSNLLGISLSGLNAAQLSLETASNNITNANTEGYSRQRVELGTRPSEFTGVGYIGNGVNVETVARSYDQFITNQLISSNSAYSESNVLSSLASQVDNIVANESTGLSPVLKSFFNAVNEVANDPSSIPVRQVMVSEANALAQQFNTLSVQFDSLLAQTNSRLQSNLDDINNYAKNVAELNAQLAYGSNRSGVEQFANELLDKRDTLIAKIAEKVSVSTIPQTDGSMSVFFGSGYPLVLGAKAASLTLAGTASDFSHKDILFNGLKITNQISGGELSGTIKFRDQILEPSKQQLGLLAAGFAIEFNELHGTGFDLNGVAGNPLFGLGTSVTDVPVIPDPSAAGIVSAAYDPTTTGQLYPSDYELSYDGTDYTLTRLSDNSLTTFSALPSTTTIAGPGFTITTTGTVAGDSFLIRPTYDAASKITTLISRPEEIAAAGANTAIPGDNTIALGLARLENQPILLNGKTTFSDAYGQLVSKVGTLTNEAKTNASAQEVLFNQAKQSQQSLAGVNLDEEAANLIKYQNSYQAAAQAISVARSLFDTLIGAVR
ncbi:MAG: flagellar hook-associated protein FlgK [Methylococcaceae bacterium]|nr:flagellar hook-associated protein FlgK [Methylococcaceae bacterium]